MSVRGVCNNHLPRPTTPCLHPMLHLHHICSRFEPQLHPEGFLVCSACGIRVIHHRTIDTSSPRTRSAKLDVFTLEAETPRPCEPTGTPQANCATHRSYSFVPRDGHFFGSSARPPTEETPPPTGRGWFNGPAVALGERAHSDRMLRVILVVDPLRFPQTSDQQPEHHQETGN